MYVDADCIDTESLSRRDPCADSSSPARYSMLATTPASKPNWWVPTSSRAGPVAYGFSDTELNESIIDGSRNTIAPIGGSTPRDRVHRDHVGVDLVDVDQPVRRGRGVIDDHQPADLVHQLGHRPQIGHRAQRRRRRGDCDQTGRRVIRLSHCQVGSSPVSMSTSAHFTLAP